MGPSTTQIPSQPLRGTFLHVNLSGYSVAAYHRLSQHFDFPGFLRVLLIGYLASSLNYDVSAPLTVLERAKTEFFSSHSGLPIRLGPAILSHMAFDWLEESCLLTEFLRPLPRVDPFNPFQWPSLVRFGVAGRALL